MPHKINQNISNVTAKRQRADQSIRAAKIGKVTNPKALVLINRNAPKKQLANLRQPKKKFIKLPSQRKTPQQPNDKSGFIKLRSGESIKFKRRGLIG